MKKTGEDGPCGPCELPLICSNCGAVITENNVLHESCNIDDDDCDVCQYCGDEKCPICKAHIHCGGCI